MAKFEARLRKTRSSAADDRRSLPRLRAGRPCIRRTPFLQQPFKDLDSAIGGEDDSFIFFQIDFFGF